MNEIEELLNKIKKDAEQSRKRIGEAQTEIQALVKQRKELRAEWEDKDSELEGDISEILQEISEIQGRQLLGEELIRTYTTK